MPRGSALGERRGGRVAGTPNRVTIEVRAIAQQHGEAMIAALVRIAKNSTSDAARVSAIKEILGKRPTNVLGVVGRFPLDDGRIGQRRYRVGLATFQGSSASTSERVIAWGSFSKIRRR